ncbi:MAG: hypothetical protein L3K15_01205 [Thermoplasmata archaeon]|nr:hypothetical protein [Thermoplasmata archaeon]
MTPAAHARAKNELLRACETASARLFVTLVHAGIAAGRAPENQDVQFGWNTILRSVDDFLTENAGLSLVQVDQSSGAGTMNYIEEKSESGLVYPAVGTRPERRVPLATVAGFSVSSARSSRIASAVDVTLGASAFCINAAPGEAVSAVAPAVAAIIEGVQFYPLEPLPVFKPAYDEAIRVLRGHSLGARVRGPF